jgi:hypothetical protein
MCSHAGQILSIRLTTPSAAATASTFATFLISETASFRRRQARLDPFHPNARARRLALNVQVCFAGIGPEGPESFWHLYEFGENEVMATNRRDRPGSDLREDVREAIERAWPDGVVEMAFDSDESWFQDVHPKLASAIRHIKGTQLVLEREPEGGPAGFDDSDPEEDPPDDQEPSRSYHLFFVCPEGEAFNYETEIELLDAIPKRSRAAAMRASARL